MNPKGIISIALICLLGLSSYIFLISEDPITRGDTYFKQMRYLDAMAWYSLDSNNAQVQWRIARAAVCYGETSADNLKEGFFRKGEKAARKSIQLDNQNANGHTWLAAALGNIAMYEGSKAKVHLVIEIRSELDIAISLNPKDDIAYSILGSVYRELGHISWLERNLALAFIGKIPDGGYPDSEKAFKRAIELAPNVMRNWFELGLLYQYWDKPDLAKYAFNRAKICPITILSDKDRLIDIAKYLEELK
jgi:tetratricopeptide (TPR) repeat protein